MAGEGCSVAAPPRQAMTAAMATGTADSRVPHRRAVGRGLPHTGSSKVTGSVLMTATLHPVAGCVL